MKFFLTFFFLSISILFFGQSGTLEPPLANKASKIININGNVRTDDYYWLKTKDRGTVLTYLKQENEYANANLAKLDTITKNIRKEFSRQYFVPPTIRQKSEDSIHNGLIIFHKLSLNGKYPVICVREKDSSAFKKLIDISLLAKGHLYFNYKLSYSPDYKTLACIFDTTGNELYQCIFVNICRAEILKESLINITSSCEWANDDHSFLYITVDSVNFRWNKLNIHKIGTSVKYDTALYLEKNSSCNLYISKDETNRIILLNSESRTGFSQQYINANKPYSSIKRIRPFSNEVIFSIKPYQNKLYILTNYKAKNFRILETSLENPADLEGCKEILPANQNVFIENFFVCNHFLVIKERKKGLPAVKVLNLLNGEFNYINFPDAAYSIDLNDVDPISDTIELNYSSPITPQIVIRYNLNTKQQQLYSYKISDTALFNPNNYILKIVYSNNGDNEIPITLFYKKGTQLDGANPLLLEAYGAYGQSEDTGFNRFLMPLVNRGVIYAIAHIRGGGEFGENWYEQGRNMNKKNSITDLINCSEYLIKSGYTSPNNFFITGGSAGGVPVGGAYVFRPDLYKAALLRAPFLDVVTTMADSTLPGVEIEYEEWGNPHIQPEYDSMLSYSPYDNIKDNHFPSLLIRSSYNDSRVMYWEAAKFVAKLRAHQLFKSNKIFLLTDMNAGHLRPNIIDEKALDYAYILYLAGIKK